MKAKYIMNPDVVTARPDTPIAQAEDLLRQHHISGLPVVDEAGQVLGVFSLSDELVKKGTLVGELMTSPAVTVDEDAGIEEIAALMAAKDVNRVPVLREGKLVGIVARADLVRYLATRHSWSESEGREGQVKG